MEFAYFIILAYALGPAAAMPYGIHFMSFWDMFITLIICYTVPIPALFYILKKMEGNDRSRIMKMMKKATDKPIKFSAKSSEWIMYKFHQRFGHIGYLMSLVFLSFALGYLWATAVAYVFEFERKRAYAAIITGTIAGLLFWSCVAYFSVNIISPSTFMLASLALALISFIAGKIQDQKVIKNMAKQDKQEKAQLKP